MNKIHSFFTAFENYFLGPLTVNKTIIKYIKLFAVLAVFTVTLYAQDSYKITGQIVDAEGEIVANISIRLLTEDGIKVQSTMSSKKRLGRGGGKFEFKKVLSGKYFIVAEIGEHGKLRHLLEVINKNVKLGKISTIKSSSNTLSEQGTAIGDTVSAAEKKLVENNAELPVDSVTSSLVSETPESVNTSTYKNEQIFDIEAVSDSQTLMQENGTIQAMDTGDTLTPLPKIRDLKKKPDVLPPGTPFFNIQEDIKKLQFQMDSLKKIIKVYEKNRGIPTIDEELVNLIKVPEFQHRIELANGTIIIGEIIDRNDLGILVQTSIGQLAIDIDKVENITDTLPPRAKVELVGGPFVEVYSDREEISGTVKNVSKKRADFVRVIASLWAADTELVEQDSVFVSGSKRKYQTGIRSDTAMKPGSTAKFKLVIPLTTGKQVGYRTYEVRWEQTK